MGRGLTLLPEIACLRETTPEIALMRFDKEPSRQIRLVRRRDADLDDWFTGLARTLRASGEELLAEVRALSLK